jgi:hypothetical protein
MAEGIKADPEAIAAFGTGVAPAANAYANEAPQVGLLQTTAGAGISMFEEGRSFRARHMNTAGQMGLFSLEAAAGCIAMVNGANYIATGLVGTDNYSASMVRAVDGQAAVIATLEVSGKGTREATIDDVNSAFNPGKDEGNFWGTQLRQQANQPVQQDEGTGGYLPDEQPRDVYTGPLPPGYDPNDPANSPGTDGSNANDPRAGNEITDEDYDSVGGTREERQERRDTVNDANAHAANPAHPQPGS